MRYFDYAATTPMSEEALEAYNRVAKTYYGNTNSLHDFGSEANQLLTQCKRHLADLLSVSQNQLFFTNGGSEANILGVKSLVNRRSRNHIIVSLAEHNSILQMCHHLESEGYEITYLPFNQSGQVDPDQLSEFIRKDTALVIVQHVNGEIGTIQPIEDISELCEVHDVLLHVDCVQSFGRIPISQFINKVDSISLSSHKIYGPKGIGILYLREQFKHRGVIDQLLKGNTVDLAGITAMTVAADEIMSSMESEYNKYVHLRATFFEHLEEVSSLVTVYEHPIKQLPSIIGLSIQGIEGQWVMLEANRQNFAISTGSACDVKYNEIPNTLKALSVNCGQANGFFRVSFGRETTVEDVIQLAEFIVKMTSQYRVIS